MSNVTKPAHYNSHPSGIECRVIARHHNFNIGNVIKYLWRAGLKNNTCEIEDLKKAADYLNDEIKMLQEKDTLSEFDKLEKKLIKDLEDVKKQYGKNNEKDTSHN